MKKIFKFFKTFLFVLIWLIFCTFLEKYWRIIHLEYIFLKVRFVFDYIFWSNLKRFIFDFDIGFYLEELLKYASYELPKEAFKFIPIIFVTRKIWAKK